MYNTKHKFKNLLIDYQNLVEENKEVEGKETTYIFVDLIINTSEMIEIINYVDFCKYKLCETIRNLFYCLARIAYKLNFYIYEVIEILDPITTNVTLNNVSNNITYMSYINGKVGEEIKKFYLNERITDGKLIIKNRVMEILVVLRNVCNLLNINLDDLKITNQ